MRTLKRSLRLDPAPPRSPSGPPAEHGRRPNSAGRPASRGDDRRADPRGCPVPAWRHRRPRDRARPARLARHHPAITVLPVTDRDHILRLPEIALHHLLRWNFLGTTNRGLAPILFFLSTRLSLDRPCLSFAQICVRARKSNVSGNSRHARVDRPVACARLHVSSAGDYPATCS
jgi:hypothetical protein